MKKYLVLFGAAILVMAWLSPSMAQAPAPAPDPTTRIIKGQGATSPMGTPSEVGRPMQFQSFGHIEIQTIWEKKPDFNTGGAWAQQADSASRKGADMTWRHIAQRYRVYLQYGDLKTVRAVLGFEADSTDWGQPKGSGTVTGGGMGVYQADQVQLEIKHAYLDFVIPNTPITITAGIQFFDVAGRMWMNNDAPGLIATANFAPHRIRAIWWRENDNNRFTYGVNDTYALTWDMTQPLFSLGAWGAYKNDLFTGQASSTIFQSINVTSAQGVASGAPTNFFDDHPYWAGLAGGFRPGNFDLSGQFIYEGGKRKFTNIVTAGAPSGDSTYNAWSAELAGKYRIGPGLFAGLEGYYSSGQDWNKNDKITQYSVPRNSEGQSNFGNDRTVFMWMNAAQMGYYHMHQTGITGYWYARANVEFSPLTWLRLNLNYLYIGDTSSGSGFSAASPGFSPFTRLPLTAATKAINTPVGSRTDSDKSYVGSELNLITTLAIYKNFNWNIGIYGFWPSDMFDRVDVAGNKIQAAEFSYGVNTKMVYAF